MGLIQDLLQEKEAYKVPEKLLSVMLDPSRKNEFLAKIADKMTDAGSDGLRDDFQEEQGDRKKLKQDYTPDCLTKLISKLVPDSDRYADICAGTGALTLAVANKHKEAEYYCEEVASRAIPFLLCNLALRNIQGEVREADALTNQIKKIFYLSHGERFSDIATGTQAEKVKSVHGVIMNPPYSLKWTPVHNEQYEDFEPLPSNAADFAFVLHGLHYLDDDGTLIAILPHGVLFRGNKEGQIRQKLIEKNLLDAIIGLPNKMFLNTSIPVCLLILKKARKNKDILFIDASKNFIKQGKQNIMEDEHIDKIVDAFINRRDIDKFAHIATLSEITQNDFNLNIPRYVDTSVYVPAPPLCDTLKELAEIEDEICKTEDELYAMMRELVGTTPEADVTIKKGTQTFGNMIAKKHRAVKNRRKQHDEYQQSLF